MLLELLARASECSVYGEDHPAVMRGMRLRTERTIRRTMRRDPAAVVVLKPLNDAQHADRLLQLHTPSRAVWIFRDYRATAASAVRKWGDTQKRIVCWLARQELGRPPQIAPGETHFATYLERMEQATHAVLARLARPEITPHDGAALLWYARTRIALDRGLPNDPRVMLVSYDDIVREPTPELARIFAFASLLFDPRLAASVSRATRAAKPEIRLHAEIEEVCERLLRTLERETSRQHEAATLLRAQHA